MSTVSIAFPGLVLADKLGARSLVTNAAFVVGGALLTAAAAQISIPMWPVPITGQTFAVLLVGTALGMWRGLLSMIVYVVLGAVGLPVFTGGVGGFESLLGGPTVGYIFGFVIAAAACGWLARRGWDRSLWGAVFTFLVGEAVIYACGLPWLAFYLGSVGYPNDLVSVLGAGLYPFVIGDLIKAALAGTLLPLVWKFVR